MSVPLSIYWSNFPVILQLEVVSDFRQTIVRVWIIVLCLCTTTLAFCAATDQSRYDLVVVGSTFSGIAAAINAAQYGHSVVIVEEYAMIGGLMTGGLSFTDFISYEALSGIFEQYTQRVESYYAEKYGRQSPQFADCHGGIHAEPHVTLKLFNEMLGEHPNIQVLTNHRLTQVMLDKPEQGMKVIQGALFTNKETGDKLHLFGNVFVDATYEGDLAAYAGAEYRIGRESRQEYGEPLAGKIFYNQGKVLVGSTGEGDHRVQAYNFRMIMTDSAENQRKVEKPANYRREDYLPIAQVLQEGKVSQMFVEKSRDGIFRSQMLPNRKADVNDIKNAPVRMTMLGENYAYPDGDWETRQKIINRHREHILGMVYFIQNDPAIPEKYRQEAQRWGLAKDEFIDADNFPPRLYIREARRIMGEYVFTQNDVNTVGNTFIVAPKEEAIAIGDYALNCHGVSPASLYPSIAEGDYNFIPPPFQIPLGVIVPQGFANLLVSVAVSASHVGFSGLRLEPVWTALGQAAGLTAHLMLSQSKVATEVNARDVQHLLHQHRAKTIYISDVATDSRYFEAAQFLGMRGFLHDLYLSREAAMPGTKTYRSIRGTQYAYAYPFHTLEPDEPLEEDLAQQWIGKLSADVASEARAYWQNNAPTRGEFLLHVYALLQRSL
ncbi:FAD-dependent oxidoreductase [Tunicatimonas pelagia]|uniref:FAD-dependent oxidoreductase n=1 Tax=Tunicatimonas pelagia TaxID=931531 RepID=UPI002665DD61|nr:FAD-dependent oxidoreductase [Tunicatimonas pelagia]WKN44877.1 FAD-dependent oxidoreductase [Tunicatimonas pelagia]